MTIGLERKLSPSQLKDPTAIPYLVGVGTAATGTVITQEELLDRFEITDSKIRSVFLNSSIEKRNLTLPPVNDRGSFLFESQGRLLDKHKMLAVEMGTQALQACRKMAGADLSDLRYLCCVTSTGLLTPGLSALIIRELGIHPSCGRSDIVGMGCNAGLNALNVISGWTSANPVELAVLLCSEACSAAYAVDGTMRTAVVNSLFGDGAAAVELVASGPRSEPAGPRILRFSSLLITDAIDAMRYDWDDDQNKLSFFLNPQIPYVVGANAETVINSLLDGTGLRRSDIDHWLVHSDGKKVIDVVTVDLGLNRHDVRHTTAVLHDHGNVL